VFFAYVFNLRMEGHSSGSSTHSTALSASVGSDLNEHMASKVSLLTLQLQKKQGFTNQRVDMKSSSYPVLFPIPNNDRKGSLLNPRGKLSKSTPLQKDQIPGGIIQTTQSQAIPTPIRLPKIIPQTKILCCHPPGLNKTRICPESAPLGEVFPPTPVLFSHSSKDEDDECMISTTKDKKRLYCCNFEDNTKGRTIEPSSRITSTNRFLKNIKPTNVKSSTLESDSSLSSLSKNKFSEDDSDLEKNKDKVGKLLRPNSCSSLCSPFERNDSSLSLSPQTTEDFTWEYSQDDTFCQFDVEL